MKKESSWIKLTIIEASVLNTVNIPPVNESTVENVLTLLVIVEIYGST